MNDYAIKTGKWLNKAGKKQRAGDYASAGDFYKKILKLDPNHMDANYLLGALYAEQGNIDKALQYTKRAESLATQSPYIKNNLGNLYRLSGDYDTAENYYCQALNIKPDLAEALNNLAILYRRQNLTEKSLRLYQAAVASNPDFISAHYNMGKAFWDLDQFEEAKACFLRVLSLDPGHALAHNEMGNYFIKQNNKEKALFHLNQYLQLSDNDSCGAQLKLAFLSAGKIPAKHPTELIQQSYEIKARTWDKNSNRANMEFLGPKIIATTLRKHIELNPKADWDILDLGCGTGLCGSFLKPLAGKLDGVDLSADMLREARKKSYYDELAQRDAEEYLLNTTNRYDLITASGVLIFFGDLRQIVVAVNRALKPGGYFVFTAYKSNGEEIEIRNNLHFSHSSAHIQKVAQLAQLQLIALDEVIHEYDFAEPQQGFTTCLKKS